jgi:hypothetical protein
MTMRCSETVRGLTFAAIFGAAIASMVSAEGLRQSKDERPGAESRQRSTQARKLEGVWDVTVVIRDCHTGGAIRTLRARNMFIRGGTLTELGAQTSSSLRTPSFGKWRYVGEHHYAAVFRFSRFNPDGSFAATQKVSRKITLDDDASMFSANALVELFDANDDPIAPIGCATETAKRLE